jgi:hypothetical protein
MDLKHEPEFADLFERGETPQWVVDAVDGALATDAVEAAGWSDSLALALGRRANRLLRERFGADPKDE